MSDPYGIKIWTTDDPKARMLSWTDPRGKGQLWTIFRLPADLVQELKRLEDRADDHWRAQHRPDNAIPGLHDHERLTIEDQIVCTILRKGANLTEEQQDALPSDVLEVLSGAIQNISGFRIVEAGS